MERNYLFRCVLFTEGILLVFFTLLCFNELPRNLLIAASPPRKYTKLLLLNGSVEEVEIQTPWDDREGELGSPEVTLGRSLFLSEKVQNELPVTSTEVKESHPNAIQERSAPVTDKCQFLKKIGDGSIKGAPTFSLAILPENANGTLFADLANFSSAESSCSLRNIPTVNGDYISNLSISDPIWIQNETIDREEVLFYMYEMSTEEGSCYKINRKEKTTTAATENT